MTPERSNPTMETPTRETPESERAWIERARRGDSAAYAMLVETHQDRAYGLALKILRVPEEAEEVTQDSFVRAWRALPRFREDARFGTWLFAIVSRQAIDRARQLQRRRLREVPLEGIEEMAAATGRGDRVEQEQLVEHLLESLSETQRAVATLFYLEDRSVGQVAEMLGLPEGTVKTHLHRARARLRERMEETGETSR